MPYRNFDYDTLRKMIKETIKIIFEKCLVFNLGEYVNQIYEVDRNLNYIYMPSVTNFKQENTNENLISDNLVSITKLDMNKEIFTIISNYIIKPLNTYNILYKTDIESQPTYTDNSNLDKAYQNINSYITKPGYFISEENKKKLKEDLSKCINELKNHIDRQRRFTEYKKLVSIKTYIVENIENIEKETGLISATALLNNLEYLTNVIMKDSDDSTGIESIDISRDIMPVLINMPFNYILNKTRNESNEITFELKPRKNKVNNK